MIILLVAICVLLAAALAVFLLSLGFVGMGWLLSRIFPLSLFETSLIVGLSGLSLAYVIGRILSTPPRPAYQEDREEEDWDEEWEDEYEEPISSPQWRRVEARKSKDVPVVGSSDPCPCGSGKKYKHCHGKRSKS